MPGRPWFDAELDACRRLGLEFHALGWSAYGVSEDRIDRFVQLVRTLPHPILIHCNAGRDRTGLAAALYRYVMLGHEQEAADDELRFLPYGHVPLFGYQAMDQAFARYCAKHPPGEGKR